MQTVARQTPLQTSLAVRFRAVRAATMDLVEPLSPEDMMVQSCPEASPVKWHLAHTTWFFETFLLRDLPGYKPFHQDFHWLFNSYYNSLGDMPAKSLRASFSRPPLADILAYRTHVDAAIERLLAQPITDDVSSRMNLGFHHEQQHQELIATDLKHALFTNPLHPPYLRNEDTILPEPLGSSSLPLTFTTLAPPNGLVEIGVNDGPETFAFDNETPRHIVFLRLFALADRLVTCAEYLAFLNDNAYTRPELWLSEGWSIMRAEGWQAPLYWQRDANSPTGWRIYTLHGFQPLPEQGGLAEAPVCHLSLFEADAYARWSGCRLPTEFEWEYAATTALEAPANLLETANLHPTQAPIAPGIQQLFGDTWEWTSSGYTGYPGYKPLPGALGEYNGKFMSSQVILRGGSCVTPATHIRPTYRNFFPPATRWQFSGLRLARDV